MEDNVEMIIDILEKITAQKNEDNDSTLCTLEELNKCYKFPREKIVKSKEDEIMLRNIFKHWVEKRQRRKNALIRRF